MMAIPRSVVKLLRPTTSRPSSPSSASLLRTTWCPQCYRALTPLRTHPEKNRRYLQTATAYQPSSLPSEPLHQPPRNAAVATSNPLGGGESDAASGTEASVAGTAGMASIATTKDTQSGPTVSESKPGTARPRKSRLRPRKAAMTLTPTAVEALHGLLDQPDPKFIRVGVKNRGCSGLAYHLEYVDKAGSFDEAVEQDGVKVLIDSKALFSIIGSEMDWVEDKLSRRFVFKNPNITEQCGCGESFSIS